MDDRRVISGILHILKTGVRWRDVPPQYGPAKTIYNRYAHWARRGIWQRIFAKVAAAGPIPDELMLDSSHVKAHRSASGGKGGEWVQAVGGLAWRQNNENPLHGRYLRPDCCRRTDTWKHRGHLHGPAHAGRYVTDPLPDRRQGLRCRSTAALAHPTRDRGHHCRAGKS